jgi:pantothenate synthetase
MLQCSGLVLLPSPQGSRASPYQPQPSPPLAAWYTPGRGQIRRLRAREFAPTEDLASYPRTFFSNLQKRRGVCTSVVFAPTAGSMYPQPATDTCAPLNGSQALNPSHGDALPAFRTFVGILGVHACSPEGAAQSRDVQYFTFSDAATGEPISDLLHSSARNGTVMLSVAAKIGTTRLLDNLMV